MRLSSELIYLHLKNRFPFSVVGELGFQLLFERPVFWLAGVSPKDYGLYLCGAENLADYPDTLPNSLLMTVGYPRETPPVCRAAFYFPEEISLLEVYNALHELYGLYENWDRKLSQMLNENSSLTDILDCSQEIFQNPILIHNRDFEFTAYSGMIDRNPAFSFLVDRERSQEAYSDFRLDQDFQKTFSETVPRFFPGTITGIRSMYINLFSRGRFIGRIVIPEVVRELKKSDLPLLQHLSQFILTAITNSSSGQRQSSIRTLNYLIGRILDGELNEDAYIEEALGTFSWQNDHEYFCAVFDMDPMDVQNSTSKMIRSRLEHLVQDSCTVEHRQKIVMFVNLTRNGHTQADVIRQFTEQARDSYLKIGCSKIYTGFRFSFQLLYRQAEIALRFGSRYMPEIWIHHFNQIADKYLLEKLISELPSEMVCAPEIVAMHHYDEEHHTEYMATLKVYLDHNMQPVSTSRELFIHRTTLIYRLDKIQELFHISLEKAYNRLFFRLSILLLETTLLNESQE